MDEVLQSPNDAFVTLSLCP